MFKNFKSRPKLYLVIALLLVCLYLFLVLINFEFLETLELVTFNLRMKMRGPIEHPGDVKIIAVDDKSLSDLYYNQNNPWPWTRDVYADLINKLSRLDVKSVIMDISFETLDFNNKAKDLEFAESLIDSQFVTLGTTLINSRREFKQLNTEYKEELVSENGYHQFRYKIKNPDRYFFPEFFSTYKLVPPADLFKNTASSYGSFEIGLPSPDGIYHHIPLVIKEEFEFDSKKSSFFLLPNIDILGLGTYYGIDRGDYTFDVANNEIILGNQKKIQVDKNGYLTLNYYGRRSFEEISAVDFLEMDREKLQNDFKNSIVLIGYTANAKGIFDARPTPFNKNESGIQLHATALQNIIDNNYFTRVSVWVNSILLFVLIILSFVIADIDNLNYSLCLNLLLVIIFNVFNYWLFLNNIWLDLFYFNLTLFGIMFVTALIKVYREKQNKLRIKNYFSRYVSAEVVDQIIDNPVFIKPGGKRKTVTVLFCDIIDFTDKAAKIEPEKLVLLLNEYFEAMTDIIKNQYGGTLDKYVGDSIVAMFGAPFAREDDPIRAIETALKMKEKEKELCEKWLARGESTVFEMGIGISTGEVVVGNIGSEERVNYTCIGDSVNVASRLEEATRRTGTDILISDSTYQAVKGVFRCKKITNLKVKGKDELLTVYSVIKRGQTNDK
jgi:adenylate cyclase